MLTSKAFHKTILFKMHNDIAASLDKDTAIRMMPQHWCGTDRVLLG